MTPVALLGGGGGGGGAEAERVKAQLEAKGAELLERTQEIEFLRHELSELQAASRGARRAST